MRSHNRALELRNSYRGPDIQLYFRDLRDYRKRKINVKSWCTIKDVKDAISNVIHVPPSAQRLYYGPLIALPNHRSLHDAGIYRSGETLLLDIHESKPLSQQPDVTISSFMGESSTRKLESLVQQARRGLSLGYKPELVPDGSGGTYFLHDARKVRIAVFKPADEEPYAANNPRGYVGDGCLREGIAPGHACLREVAAYLLDHKGFASVPMTTLVEARHPAFHSNGSSPLNNNSSSVGNHSLTGQNQSKMLTKKTGSFQAFAKAECTMDDMSPSKISKDEVHKIAILDIRLMNADRNSANLLCRRRLDNSLELIPIDHGFCLRSECDVSWMDWCWLDWPQLKEPLSRKTKEYILKLDVDADIQLLKDKLHIQGKALNFFRASNKLLQQGVQAGLSLYEIAVLCCRNDDLGEIPSKLELLTDMATELSTSAISNGKWHHAAASRAIEEQLSPDNLRGTGNRMPRSFSNVNFASLVQQHEDQEPPKNNSSQEDVPGMTQSAASDASSDVGDGADHEDDCEEWAAAIVQGMDMQNNVQVNNDNHNNARQERKTEDDSDSTLLSSSPHGFWHIRPGEQDSDDDETVTWTPNVSPKTLVNLNLGDLEHLEPPPFPGLSTGGGGTVLFSNSPTVAFHDSLNNSSNSMNVNGRFLLPPPATMDFTTGKRISSPPTMRKASFPDKSSNNNNSKPAPRRKKIMSRSQSFGAFHSNSFSSSNSGNSNNKNKDHNNDDESTSWKTYFNKFVDIVIVRETNAAVAAKD